MSSPLARLQMRAAVVVDRFVSEGAADEAEVLRALIGVAAGRLAHLDELGALTVLRNVAAAVERSRGLVQ